MKTSQNYQKDYFLTRIKKEMFAHLVMFVS